MRRSFDSLRPQGERDAPEGYGERDDLAQPERLVQNRGRREYADHGHEQRADRRGRIR